MSPDAGTVAPYEQVEPGDLISADLFNSVQTDIRTDLADQVANAVKGITKVPSASDAEHLDGKTIDQIEAEILDKLRKELPKLVGDYRQVFKRLEVGQEYVVKHKLHAMPLVDVYQLDYFLVVAATGENPEDRMRTYVNFYLYHDSERTIRTQAMVNGQTQPQSVTVDIELRDETAFRVPFKDMLERYEVSYTDSTSLDELVNNFWNSFFNPDNLNDRFDSDQYAHSPWFEKCCGEQRSVEELKARGDWDHIWLKWRARKTINFPAPIAEALAPGQAPTNIQVAHFDWDNLGITLLENPVYVPWTDPNASAQGAAGVHTLNGQQNVTELKVMLLLKA